MEIRIEHGVLYGHSKLLADWRERLWRLDDRAASHYSASISLASVDKVVDGFAVSIVYEDEAGCGAYTSVSPDLTFACFRTVGFLDTLWPDKKEDATNL